MGESLLFLSSHIFRFSEVGGSTRCTQGYINFWKEGLSKKQKGLLSEFALAREKKEKP